MISTYFITMLSEMFSPSQRLQILRPVIQWIAVPVMDNAPRGQRSVRFFPHHDGTQAPVVRLGNLDPGADDPAMRAFADRAHGKPVLRTLPLFDLGGPAPALSPGDWLEAHVRLCATGDRAVVHLAEFRWLPLERRSAYRARALHGCALALHLHLDDDGISVQAFCRTEDQSTSRSANPVWLDVDLDFAGPAVGFHSHNFTIRGTGTTALVACVHGRIGMSFDLSHDYGRLARWRTTDPGERARALNVPKPPPVSNGQADLFEEGIA